MSFVRVSSSHSNRVQLVAGQLIICDEPFDGDVLLYVDKTRTVLLSNDNDKDDDLGI